MKMKAKNYTVKFNKIRQIALYLKQLFIMIKNLRLLVLFILSAYTSLNAQEIVTDTIKGVKTNNSEPKQKKMLKIVKLKDGSFYNGYIIEENAREILMDIDGLGKMYIPKFSIKSIEIYDSTKIENGEIKEERLTNRNYMFNRSALPFDTKKLTFDLPNLIFAQVNYAINENIRIGIFSSIIATPMGINLGLSYKLSKELYIGGDINYGGFFLFTNTNNINGNSNDAYIPNIFNVKAKLTSGNIDKHLTVIAGYSVLQYKENVYTGGRNVFTKAQTNGLNFSFCGAYKVSKNLSMLGEINWQQIGENDNIILIDPAIRLHSGRRSSFVLGINMIVNTNNNGGIPALPLPHVGANFIFN
jgi:hypothetical protein